MCGRFSLISNAPQINRHYGTDNDLDLKARYNVSPGTTCPLIRLHDDNRELALLHWGFIPHWAKDTKLKPINAKAETVNQKPFFRDAFKKRRCLIPANGYYEWRKEKKGKQPYYIRPIGMELISFAGLWDIWEGPDGNIESFTIITTDANEKTADIHNRMPVVIEPRDYDPWLIEGDKSLLRPCPDSLLECYKVPTLVNKPDNEGNDLIKPV